MSAPAVTAMVPAGPNLLVTDDQRALVKRTIFPGATDDEMALYLHDCARQGVHPLDKMIHPSVRKAKDGSRKYVPITSIDYMRARADDTGKYAGSDDAVFSGTPKTADFVARVTVWKMVEGQRCPFVGTARWSEYKPDKDDWMWLKMPHGQLAKCAEALALRKGFPRQLQGLYAREEMAQAADYTPPTKTSAAFEQAAGGDIAAATSALADAFPNTGDRSRFLAATKQLGWDPKESDAWLYRKTQRTWKVIPKAEFAAIVEDLKENGARFDETSMVPDSMVKHDPVTGEVDDDPGPSDEDAPSFADGEDNHFPDRNDPPVREPDKRPSKISDAQWKLIFACAKQLGLATSDHSLSEYVTSIGKADHRSEAWTWKNTNRVVDTMKHELGEHAETMKAFCPLCPRPRR